MAVKTSVKTRKTGIDVLLTSPGYIASPDKKYLEIKKYNLDLQVQVPASGQAAEMKSELACKAEATACEKRINAELAALLKTVQECKRKEAGGNKKAAEEADKERKKALDKIQDHLADSRAAMRKSIAAALKLQPKQIMTFGRGVFGDKAIRFPKDLFQELVEAEPEAKTTKSVDTFVEDGRDVAKGFDGLANLRKGIVDGLNALDKALEESYKEVVYKGDKGEKPPSRRLPPNPPQTKEINDSTKRERRVVSQQVQDFEQAIGTQQAELDQFKATLGMVEKIVKKDTGLQGNANAKRALDEGLKKLKGACGLLEKDLSAAWKTVGTAQELMDEKSLMRWSRDQRGWLSRVKSLDSTELLHAESVAKNIEADLARFDKNWKRAWK